MNWQDIIDSILGGARYKRLYNDTLLELQACHDNSAQCIKDRELLLEENERLRLVASRPAPPRIKYIVEKDSAWVQGIVDGLDAAIVRLPLGDEFRLTSKTNFENIVIWDWIDTVEYRKYFRCGNFAIAFKAHVDEYFGLNQVGIVLDYKAGHAYNLVIFADGKVMCLEPQTDQMFWSDTLPAPFYTLEGAVVII